MRNLAYISLLTIGFSLTCCSSDDDNQSAAPINQTDIIASIETSRSTPFVGFNQQGLSDPLASDTEFYDLLESTSPTMLRYPGGVESQYWDWQAGGIIDEKNWTAFGGDLVNNFNLSQVPQPSNILENFKQKIDKLGAEPLYCLNVLSSTLEEQVDMLLHAESIGLPVNYIELGNELYLSEEDYLNKYPTAEDYALAMRTWIPVIRENFPAAKIGICGTGISGNRPDRQINWNEPLFDLAENVDAIIMHPYPGSVAEGRQNFDETLLPTILSSPFKRNQFNAIGPPGNPTAGINAFPENWEVWFTEYNLFEFNPEQPGTPISLASTWIHGLFSGLLTVLPIRNERVTVLLSHVTHTGIPSFAAIVTEYQLNNNNLVRIGDWDLSAYGMVHQLIFNAAKNRTSVSNLTFSKNPNFFDDGTIVYPSLVGAMFQGADQSAIIFNIGAQEKTIDVTELFPQGGAYSSYTIEPGNYARTEVRKADLTIVNNVFKNVVTIPAYGIISIE